MRLIYYGFGMIRQFILMILLGTFTAVNAQTDRQLISEGNRMYHKQDYAKAEVLYRKAIAKNQSNPQALYNLGCALMMQSKDSAAIVQYENAAKVEKNKQRLASVYHNIGVICQNNKLYGDAINAYQQSLRNNPNDDETRYNLALCKRQQKNQDNKDNNQNKDKKDNEDKNGQSNKDQDKKENKDKDNQQQQQQQQQEQMSKDNAEQMLNAAIQNEKDTQERMKKAMQKPSSRHLEKNW